ncbi:MAG TPA: hypothetical protein VMW15_07605 [Terracidiphilus sp.]|nr:hypothetical protein [Terracidiphilus sp.]
MKQLSRIFSRNVVGYILVISSGAALVPLNSRAQQANLCLDGFCIGQSIKEARFDQVAWITPRKDLAKEKCDGIGCKPEIAFRGYPSEDQAKLSDAVSWKYVATTEDYNIVSKENLGVLRLYKYECNASARGIRGERRFFGAYLSTPSQYLTVVGLRLINGSLTVYRVARQYPYHNPHELASLAKELKIQYGGRLLLFDGISSNAYYEVIEQRKDAWFGRSTVFNPSDLSNNAAELVLIDPNTRALLEPTSMPESGEIRLSP